MEWELSKENVQPLRGGRNVESLEAALVVAKPADTERQRQSLVAAIAAYSGPDPLLPRLRYIKWLQQTYPSGSAPGARTGAGALAVAGGGGGGGNGEAGAQSLLVAALEECTRAFAQSEQYRDDVRYLRTWVLYADCCADPSDVFSYLVANGIGQTHALFYEAHATFLELRHNFARAHAVYETAIARRAQPLERLQAKFDDFQRRMVRRIQRQMSEAQDAAPPAATTAAAAASGRAGHRIGVDENGTPAEQRRMLGSLVGASGASAASARGLRPSSRSSGLGTRRGSSLGDGGRTPVRELQVYADDSGAAEGQDGGRGGLASPGPEMQPAGVLPWASLGTISQRRKENVSKPQKWTDARLPGSVGRSGGGGAFAPAAQGDALEIYVDEELRDADDEDTRRTATEAESVAAVAAAGVGAHAQFRHSSLRQRIQEAGQVRQSGAGGTGVIAQTPTAQVAYLSATAGSAQAESVGQRGWTPSVTVSTDFSTGRSGGHNGGGCIDDGGSRGSADRADDALRLDAHRSARNEALGSSTRAPAPRLLAADGGSLRPTRHHEDDDANLTVSSSNLRAGGLACEPAAGRATQVDGQESQAGLGHLQLDADGHGERAGHADWDANGAAEHQAPPSAWSIPHFEAGGGVLPAEKFGDQAEASESEGQRCRRDDTVALVARAATGFQPLRVLPADEEAGVAGQGDGPFGRIIGEEAAGAGNVEGARSGACEQDVTVHTKMALEDIMSMFSQPLVPDAAAMPRRRRDGHRAASAPVVEEVASEAAAVGDSIFVWEDEPDDLPAVKQASIDFSSLQLGAGQQGAGEGVTKHEADAENRPPSTPPPPPPPPPPQAALPLASAPGREPLPAPESHSSELLLRFGIQDAEKRPLSPVTEVSEGSGASHSSGSAAATSSAAAGGDVSRPAHASASSSPPQLTDGGLQETVGATADAVSVAGERAEIATAGRPVGVNVVNPYDQQHSRELLQIVEPQLAAIGTGLLDHRPARFGGATALKATQQGRRGATLQAGPLVYGLEGVIGEGAFATVYRAFGQSAEDMQAVQGGGSAGQRGGRGWGGGDEFDDDDGGDDEDPDASTLAIKVQMPAWPWEMYISHQVRLRVAAPERARFMVVRRMHLWADASALVTEMAGHHTLQDAVNAQLRANGKGLEEDVVMFFTVELLRALEVLEEVGILHGDIKPDNLMIQDVSQLWDAHSTNRRRNMPGLKLVDWGRSIDRRLYPAGTVFMGDCNTSAFRCVEMLEGRPWTYQVDTFGLCSTVHCLLFGKYLELQRVGAAGGGRREAPVGSGGRYAPRELLRRYWQVDLWQAFFDSLLNADAGVDRPPLSALRDMFEGHLARRGDRALRISLMKLTVLLQQQDKQKARRR